MDRGTNAVNVLKNSVVPLRLGYVAVVNRSQADINGRKSMAEARRCGRGLGRSVGWLVGRC
jgi:dynamin 1-like protein